MNKISGFTLVELMITLAIFALLTSLAYPGVHSFVQNSRAATQTNELITALQLARSEAIKQGALVSICASADQTSCSGTWDQGWIVFVDGAASANASTVTVSEILRTWAPLPGGATLGAGGANHVRFLASGGVAQPAAFEYRIAGCTRDQGRNIAINRVGRATLQKVACS